METSTIRAINKILARYNVAISLSGKRILVRNKVHKITIGVFSDRSLVMGFENPNWQRHVVDFAGPKPFDGWNLQMNEETTWNYLREVNPHVPICNVPLLTDEEKRKIADLLMLDKLGRK